MMGVSACILTVRPHARVREQLAFRAVHVQERFLLAFAKDKMRDGLPILGNRQPLAGSLRVSGGFHRPSGLDGKRKEQEKDEQLFHDKGVRR